VAVGRAERWRERKPRAAALFGDDATTLNAVEQLFELLEMAWHDVYGEITPSEQIVDEVLLCSGGTLSGLIEAARTAVRDRRDLSVWASTLRAQRE
jgi:uncharacterized tellurite resistance protein B-like protein